MNNINFHKLYKLIVEEHKLCTEKQYQRFIVKFLLWFVTVTLLVVIPGTVVIGNIVIPVALIISLISLVTVLEGLSENPEIFPKLNKLFLTWPLFAILNIAVIILLKYLNY